MSGELDGTYAFVTGGGTGIGRASAIALAQAGSTVTVAGRTQSTLDEVVTTSTAPEFPVATTSNRSANTRPSSSIA